MRTPKQTQASRTNGAKSKGPVTPKGKRNSSCNSIRHGLLAETVVLEDEHNGRLFALLNDLLDEHQPATPTQTLLVETLAAAVWRQKRIWGMQKVAFDEDVASVDSAPESPALRAVLALRASAECVRSHELMLRYEVALDRQISRSLLRLQQLQEKAGARAAQQSVLSDPKAQSVRRAHLCPPEQPIATTAVLRDSKRTRTPFCASQGKLQKVRRGPLSPLRNRSRRRPLYSIQEMPARNEPNNLLNPLTRSRLQPPLAVI